MCEYRILHKQEVVSQHHQQTIHVVRRDSSPPTKSTPKTFIGAEAFYCRGVVELRKSVRRG